MGSTFTRQFGGRIMRQKMTLDLAAKLALGIAIVLGFFPLCGIMARHVPEDHWDDEWP